MVVTKGLGTSKIRVAGGREAGKSGRVRSLKVYTDDDNVKIRNKDHVTVETKKPIPVKGEISNINVDIQKALNKVEKLFGKNFSSAQVNVGRKVLADISNSRGVFQKNDTFVGSKPGKSKMEKVAYPQRASVGTKANTAITSSGKDLKVFNGNPKTTVRDRKTVGPVSRASTGKRASTESSSSTKDLKVFNGNQKTSLQGQETVGHVIRKTTKNCFPLQRKSFPILNHVKKADNCDPKNGNLELTVKNKDTYGFSVKPKVGTSAVSNARDNRWKHRVSEGSLKMVSEAQPPRDTRRLSRISMKPTVKTTVVIPKASTESSSSSKVLKVSNGNQNTRLQGQETVGHVIRKSTKNCFPIQRKSFPISKHVKKADNCDPKKGYLQLPVKNKDTYGFSVKPKVGTTVLPSVSNARDNRLKHRVSEGSLKMVSERQPPRDAKRLSRVSMKPTVKTTVVIPKAKRVSKSISVLTKPTSTSGSSSSNHTESVSCEQKLDANTSNITAKGKRRKSYTSLLIERTKLLKDERNVTKEEILPNIYDDGNQLEVAEYVDEIYRHYWVTEAHNPSLKNYMEIQTDITPQMRGRLINWLVEVHLKFDLMQETLYLMVTLLDYYLSVATIKRSEMQLVGLTSLLLASKYEDFWHPKVMELIGISAEIYTRDQMLEMETTILTKLNFRLNLPTPYVFMLQFLRAAQGGKTFENLAFYLIELCLVEYDALHFKPSLLCASAIYVARCTLNLTPAWTPLLCKHSHYREFQIRDCADMILRFHKAAKTAPLRVTYDKFMSRDKCEVASIKPLNKLPPP
ncbi:uncharacterized protein [Rutidosis leptorrhynchoides]|uniref:uncharacterized protein isoform X2 n=1 Tax=Rutidosis leptorrhynchoides TaxID=125765 RepID=UPI003A9A4077